MYVVWLLPGGHDGFTGIFRDVEICPGFPPPWTVLEIAASGKGTLGRMVQKWRAASYCQREEKKLNDGNTVNMLRLWLVVMMPLLEDNRGAPSGWRIIHSNEKMSRLMGKPTIYIGENKDADQLRGCREADQRLCFRYSDSTMPLLLKSKISSFYLFSVLVQAALCRTCSETTLLVFPRGGSNNVNL